MSYNLEITRIVLYIKKYLIIKMVFINSITLMMAYNHQNYKSS
jgi:hypothetical protein